GGDGNDKLYGESGNDVFDGGLGNDYLEGGSGNDRYLFGSGGGQDILRDYDTAAGNIDTVEFGADPLDLIFSRSVNDLKIEFAGTNDTLTVQSWYSSANYQTELVQTADGSSLSNIQVNQLIQAMATFGAESGLSWAQAIQERPDEVQTILAAHWQPAA
ncbi:MAG: calcium-binding protein, partial [Trichloromonas sp.]|nr:calcium-binding protein [Trichloromonas sp.]